MALMFEEPGFEEPGFEQAGRAIDRPVRLAVALVIAALLIPASLTAQQPTPEIAGILERLDRLERENRALSDQVRELKTELAARAGTAAAAAPSGAPAATSPETSQPLEGQVTMSPEEQLTIQGNRIQEQAQTKLEASQKFPIRLTGMALFNAFINSRQSGTGEYPTAAASAAGSANEGAAVRQTIVGLEFHGPRTFLGGHIHGSVYMDFAAGGATFNETMRLRTGSIQIDWKTRSILVGIEKPVFNPREPASLAQVAISPLTGTGNLWLWLPQARVEQDIAFNSSTGIRARLGLVETHEVSPYASAGVAIAVAPARPAMEGRFEFYHNLDDERRLELAAGFHESVTHAAGVSIPSHVFALDWFFNPWKKVDVTGAFYTGQNVANLGTGIVNEGYAVYRHSGIAIASTGGWNQFTIHAAPRLDFHVFAGLQYYESSVLGQGDVNRDFMSGVNLFYRLAPNVIFGPEISQLRTSYLGLGTRINNHYDLALGYLF